MVDGYLLELLKQEIPKYLKKILEIDKKSELEKYCKDIAISQEDFANLALNSYKIGYLHQIKYHDFTPPHLNPTNEEISALGSARDGEPITGSAKKFINKISAIFNERRYLVAHIFLNETKWHLFYFDQRDTENIRKNHWKEGVHIHFVNYLWPQYDIKRVWESFNRRDASVGDKLHIRFTHQE